MTLLASPSARAALLAALCFACYNANGRELGSYDSQPSKFLAREILQRHTLTLDATVAAVPAYAQRPGFVRTPDGHYRSAYSIAPAIAAAIVGWPLTIIQAIDLQGPMSPGLIAKLTASLLSSIAVAFVFLTARRYASARGPATAAGTAGSPDAIAAFVAIGFGLGTNVWALASQTLWQHECVLLGLSVAVWALTRPSSTEGGASYPLSHPSMDLWIASAGLGLAGWARPQVAPAIAVLALALIARRLSADDEARDAARHGDERNTSASTATLAGAAASGRARARLAAGVPIGLLPLIAGTALPLWLNMRWFGHPLGAVPLLESLHPVHHAVAGSLARDPWWGALGLLVSPSRGLLIFSPIVLVALLSLPRAWREGWRDSGALRWLWLATLLQFALYAFYSVWWAGHTYGPRYLIDLLPLLVPPAAAGTARLLRTRAGATAGAIALAWSILIAATGAFCYPADAWNTDPASVDINHARLWEWRDPQFVRCWQRGTSPQNFSFLEAGAFTAPPPVTVP